MYTDIYRIYFIEILASTLQSHRKKAYKYSMLLKLELLNLFAVNGIEGNVDTI